MGNNYRKQQQQQKQAQAQVTTDLFKQTLLHKMKDHDDEYTKIKEQSSKYSLVSA